jgi:hypothetical protein
MAGHGRPDWYNITPLVQIHASEDINELAARLGSVNVFDRRGNVIRIYTFESGMGDVSPTAYISGSDCYLTLSPTYHGLPIIDMYTTMDATAYTKIYGNGPTELSDSFGIEFIFSQAYNSNQIDFSLAYVIGGYQYSAAIRLGQIARAAHYYNSSGTWTQISGDYNVGQSPFYFNHLKFAIDISGNQYLRMIFNSSHVSLVGTPMKKSKTTSDPVVSWYVKQYGSNLTGCDLYLAAVILTINEL